jgi:hypothetical protein
MSQEKARNTVFNGFNIAIFMHGFGKIFSMAVCKGID